MVRPNSKRLFDVVEIMKEKREKVSKRRVQARRNH